MTIIKRLLADRIPCTKIKGLQADKTPGTGMKRARTEPCLNPDILEEIV